MVAQAEVVVAQVEFAGSGLEQGGRCATSSGSGLEQGGRCATSSGSGLEQGGRCATSWQGSIQSNWNSGRQSGPLVMSS